MLIYLDLCCFNRPFDDQSQLIVRLQTEAKLNVQVAILEGRYELAWSAVIDLENTANPSPDRRNTIVAWRRIAVMDQVVTVTVEDLAELYTNHGLKSMDALHVACALTAEARYFLTTDKILIHKMADDPHIRVVDPIDFVREMEREDDEN